MEIAASVTTPHDISAGRDTQNEKKMTRETRYHVLKIKDVEKYCTKTQLDTIVESLLRIDRKRCEDGQRARRYLVIESDWPEYGTVREMLEARESGQPNEIEALHAEFWRLKRELDDARGNVEKALSRQAELQRENDALKTRCQELEETCSDLETERDDAEHQPWPEWAEAILQMIRKRSGYDGFDDAEGVDLPEELRELLSGNDAEIERLRNLLAAKERAALDR